MRHLGIRAAAILLLTAAACTSVMAQPSVSLPAADQALAGSPMQLYSVGQENGRDWETFATIGAVAFDPSDHLYVLDRGNHRVLVFDPQGHFVRQIGRKGHGPGELISPSAVVVTAPGEVVISDPGRRAYSVFGLDGAFLRNVPLPQQETVPGAELQAHPRGGVVSSTLSTAVPEGSSITARPGVTVAWHTFDSANPEVALFRGAEEATQTTDSETGGARDMGLRMTGTEVFSPGVHWSVLPSGGVAIATTADYHVRITDPAGQVVRVIQRPITPRAVTASDRAEARERHRRALTTGEGATFISADGSTRPQLPAQFVDQHVANLRFADRIPVIRGITAAPSGRLWVQRSGQDPVGAEAVDLLTPEGRYLGTLPAGTAIPDAFSATGRAAYVEHDELGVERVVVRTLPASWR